MPEDARTMLRQLNEANAKLVRHYARRRRLDFVVVFAAGVVFGLVLACLLWPLPAEARWSPEAFGRIRADRAIIIAAAEATGTDPALLAAIAGHETQATAIPSKATDADGRPLDWGPMQVRWRAWGEQLAEVGIARRPEELLDPGVGYLAGAWVLSEKRRLYGAGRTRTLLICLFGGGSEALSYVEDCDYSDAVEANLRWARLALGGE